MDSLDVRILRTLMMGGGSFFGNDVRRPYRMIAGKLGVTDDTVRSRVERYHAMGFIKGWKLGVNPALFGRQGIYLFFDVRPPSAKKDVVRKIKVIDGVQFILSYFGSFLGVQMTYGSEQDLRKKSELIRRVSNSENLVSMKTSFPACGVRLAPTDWRLIQALRKDPRAPFSAIAEVAVVSPRTARRRTERMVRSGAVYTLPDIDLRGLEGAVVASLSVYYSDPSSAQNVATKIISEFEERLIIFHISDREHGWFGFVLPNIAMANEIEERVKGIEGVRGTLMRLAEDFVNLVDEANEDEVVRNIGVTAPEVKAD